MADKLKTYVISLLESRDRRSYISQQFRQHDCSWDFFDAIAGRDASGHFEGFDEVAYFAASGRVASAGEIGCFASHAALWKHCADTSEPIVILEDDARLSPEFGSSVNAASKMIGKLGFVRLQDDGPRRKQQKVLVDQLAPFDVFRCQRFPFGAMAYAISPHVACSFYRQGRIVTEPVDSFIKRFWRQGEVLYGIAPATVTGGPLRHESTISGRSKTRLSFGERRLRFVRKASDFVQWAIFNRPLA